MVVTNHPLGSVAGKHENVVEIRRITHLIEGHKGTPYIVMDYVERERSPIISRRQGPCHRPSGGDF